MLSGDAFLALEDNHAQAGVPTSEIWERVDARIEREDSLIAAQLRWNLRARAKHGFFETWSPFWFEFDQEFDRSERSVKQIVSAAAISVLDAIIDGRITPENGHVAEQLKSIALEWASGVQITSRIASSYRYRLLRWCAPNHSIATGSSCRSERSPAPAT